VGIPRALWSAADSLTSNDSSKIVAISQPDDINSEFYEVAKPGSRWKSLKISAFDTPNFTGEELPQEIKRELVGQDWVEDKKRRWGISNPLYQSKVLAEFPVSNQSSLIPLSWVRQAQLRELPPGYPVEMGMDVGAGGDRSVIALRRGGHVRIIRSDNEPDTMKSCGNLLADMRKYDPEVVKVDYYGVGQGVVDRARELRASGEIDDIAGEVSGVYVGGRANDSEQYLNLRAEGFDRLRDLFERGEIDIDPEDEDLAAELVAIRRERASSGKEKIEDKRRMKRRLHGISPDKADAVMLAFLEETTPEDWGEWGVAGVKGARAR